MWPIAVYMVICVFIIHGVEVVLVLVKALSEGLNGLLNVVLENGGWLEQAVVVLVAAGARVLVVIEVVVRVGVERLAVNGPLLGDGGPAVHALRTAVATGRLAGAEGVAEGERGFLVAQGFNRVQLDRNGGFSLK